MLFRKQAEQVQHCPINLPIGGQDSSLHRLQLHSHYAFAAALTCARSRKPRQMSILKNDSISRQTRLIADNNMSSTAEMPGPPD